MAHLTEHTTVGRGDTLNSGGGVVGIVLDVVGHVAVQIHVLGRDLSVLGERTDGGLISQEATLTVGDRHRVDLAGLGQRQPGRFVGGDPGAYQLGLVTADGVEGQSGRVCVTVGDLAVGHQAQLDQCLEAVADTAHQTVATFQQIGHLFLDRCAAEEGGNKLTGSVGLVAAGESAGHKDDLGIGDLPGECLRRAGNVIGGQIADDEQLGLRSCGLHGLGGIVLAVGAGEYGDQNPGTGDLHSRCGVLFRLIQRDLGRRACLADIAGVNFLQLVLVQRVQIGGGNRLAVPGEGGVGGDHAQGVALLTSRCHLAQECAVEMSEQRVQIRTFVVSEAEAVTHSHLHHRLGDAAVGGGVGGEDLALGHQGMDLVIQSDQGSGIGASALLIFGNEQSHTVACGLEIVGDYVGGFAGGYGEGNQGGRNVQILKGSAHGVLTANGSHAQIQLCVQRSQKSRQGLAPTLGILHGLLEIFLEGQIYILKGGAGGDQLGDGFHNGQIGAGVGITGGDHRVVTPGHKGCGVGIARLAGDLVGHSLNGRALILTAEGHQQGARTDGGVEGFGKTPLGAHVQIGGQRLVCLRKGGYSGRVLCLRLCHTSHGVLLRTVGVEEFTGNIHDHLAPPQHGQTGIVGDVGHHGGLQIFACRDLAEASHVAGLYHHSHSLLRFADGQLRSVQTLVLLGYPIQIDTKTVCQFTDGNGNTAGTEVIAALDQAGRLGIAEQSLKLSLLGGITLLNLRTAGGQGFGGVGFGGAGGTAASVTAGTAAQKDDHVTGGRNLAAYVFSGSGRDDRTDLHTLGRVAGVIDLVYHTGGQTDLVTVGGIAGRCRGHDLALGQLARHSLGYGTGGIGRAGHTHSGVYIGTAGQRIADRTADTGGGTAEGLDLGGMVVRFILKEEQPVFLGTVMIHLHLNGAGVDLLALVQLGQLALCLQGFRTDGGDVHEVEGLGVTSQGVAGIQIPLPGCLGSRILKGYGVDGGEEGGVTAVIAPVGVDHADLRDGGIPLLFPEICLAEGGIRLVHSQTVLLHEIGKATFIQLAEAVQHRHVGRNGILGNQGFLLGKGCLPGLHGIDYVFLDSGKFVSAYVAGEHVDFCRLHERSFTLGEELYALCGGVRSLIELTGQIFHGEHGVVCLGLQGIGDDVQLGLRKDGVLAVLEQLQGNALHVIAVEDTDIRHGRNGQKGADVGKKGAGLACQFFLFFNKDSVYHM